MAKELCMKYLFKLLPDGYYIGIFNYHNDDDAIEKFKILSAAERNAFVPDNLTVFTKKWVKL